MIKETDLLEELTLIGKQSWKHTGIPFEWDMSQGRLKINKTTILTSALMTALFGISQIIHGLQNITEGMSLQMQATGLLLIFGAAAVFVIARVVFDMYLEPDLVEAFISQIVKFEQDHKDREGRGSFRYRKIALLASVTCKLIRFSTMTLIPPLAGLTALMFPNIPVNLAGTYPPKLILVLVVQPMGTVAPLLAWVLEKVLIFGLNSVLWYFTSRAWSIYSALLLMGCVSLSNSVLTFQRQFRIESSRHDVLIHRKVQLLARLFNEMESTHLVVLLFITVNAEIFCALGLLQQGNDLDVSMKTFAFLGLVNSMIAIIVFFGFCGDVYDTSSKCLKRIKSRDNNGLVISNRTRMEYKRIVRSLPLVKVRFGSMNFVEKMTPVVFQHFTSLRIMDCLLLGVSK